MAGMEAIVGTARAGAFRSGYFARNRVLVELAGTRVKTRLDTLAIRQPVGREPSTADLSVQGRGVTMPDRGQSVVIGHGTMDNVLFRGRIVRSTRLADRHAQVTPRYDLEAVDTLFDLGRCYAPVGFSAESTSATSLVPSLISAVTPSVQSIGVTAPYVQAGLPVVARFDVPATESLVSAFDRLALAIGATWFTDMRQQLHFYVDADPQPRPMPSTLTSGTSGFWRVTRDADLGRVFSRVVGLGIGTTLAFDTWSDGSQHLPLAAFDDVSDGVLTLGLDSWRLPSTYRVAVGGIPTSVDASYRVGFPSKPAARGAVPTSNVANSLWCANVAWAVTGIAGVDGFREQQWVGLEGNYFHIESITVTSTTVNTDYAQVFVYQSGPGAPPATAVGAVPDGTVFTPWPNGEYRMSGSLTGPRRILTAGTDVRVFYEATSTTITNAVGSLTGVAALATDVLDDSTLRGAQLIEACSKRLGESAPDRWLTYTYETRDIAIERGVSVPLALTSPGESGGPAMTGTFPVQAVEFGDFASMADGRGPVRRVTLGPVGRPTLYDELSRWDV